MLDRIRTRFVRQPKDHVKRVWYHSLESDFVLDVVRGSDRPTYMHVSWEEPNGSTRTVTWTVAEGIKTGNVDLGEPLSPARNKRSPVIDYDEQTNEQTVIDAKALLERSELNAEDLEMALALLES